MAPLGGEVSVGVGNFDIPICPPAGRHSAGPEFAAGTTASSGYFAALGIPFIDGRDFTPSDAAVYAQQSPGGGPFPIVINEAFARKYFASASAIGQLTGPPQ
jgi:hypothetical protein